MNIQVTQLGLAAYIQMKGAKLLKVEGRHFHFESDKTLSAWKVEYANSECSRHDALVCELRSHLNKSPP
jgi:hypothetical protein